jgi:hypothetical protein
MSFHVKCLFNPGAHYGHIFKWRFQHTIPKDSEHCRHGRRVIIEKEKALRVGAITITELRQILRREGMPRDGEEKE